MELSQPARPTKPLTLTIELSNTRTDRGKRLRNRTESYVLGFTLPYDLFSFCCYRALLLGTPSAIVRATVQPGKQLLLTEPMPPQRLRGEETVEGREWSNREALLFRMQSNLGHANRRFFGYRNSHAGQWHPSGIYCPPWLRYQPEEVILDGATGRPPTFVDVEDFQRKSQVLAKGQALTPTQAWSTWFWLLLKTTFNVANRHSCLVPWHDDLGIQFRGRTLVKSGC